MHVHVHVHVSAGVKYYVYLMIYLEDRQPRDFSLSVPSWDFYMLKYNKLSKVAHVPHIVVNFEFSILYQCL